MAEPETITFMEEKATTHDMVTTAMTYLLAVQVPMGFTAELATILI